MEWFVITTLWIVYCAVVVLFNYAASKVSGRTTDDNGWGEAN